MENKPHEAHHSRRQISFRTYDTFGGSQDVTFVRSVFPKNAKYHATVELLCSDSLSCVEFFTRFRIELNLLFILCATLPPTRFPFLIRPRFLEKFFVTYIPRKINILMQYHIPTLALSSLLLTSFH